MRLHKLIPRQIHIPYIGAIYELLGRVFFFISLVSFVLNTRVQYYNVGDTWLRDTFGVYWFFMLVLICLAVVITIFIWIFLLPSQYKHIQDQATKPGINPIYDKLCEIENRIMTLEAELDEKNGILHSLNKKQ